MKKVIGIHKKKHAQVIAAAVEKTKFRLHETVDRERKIQLLRDSKILLIYRFLTYLPKILLTRLK